MSETAETYNLEIDSIKKEGRDLLIAYEIASATERQTRDAFLAWCRDHLHNYLKQIGYGDPREVHIVLDMIDEFLNRAGGRRK